MRKLGSEKMTLLRNRKITIFIVILVIILMFLGFSSFLLIPHSMSRYRNGKLGNGQVSIARWNVYATSNDSSINLVCGSTTTYTFTVNNNSDVSVLYSIEIGNLPTGVQVKLDSGSYISPSNNTIVISNAGELGYSGTTQRTHTLTFNTPLSTSEVSNRQVSVNVTFKQKIS